MPPEQQDGFFLQPVDIQQLCLAEEGDKPSPADDWVRIINVGKFRHQKGTVEVTEEMVAEMATNFQADVLGVRVPVDNPEHQNDGRGRFGWVTKMEARSDGLHAKFDWNTQGRKMLAGEQFGYLSPVVNFAGPHRPYTVPDSGKRVSNVVTSLSPTNHPQMRDNAANVIAAAEESESTEEEQEAASSDDSDNGAIGADSPQAGGGTETMAETQETTEEQETPEETPAEDTQDSQTEETPADEAGDSSESTELSEEAEGADSPTVLALAEKIKGLEADAAARDEKDRIELAEREVASWQCATDVKDAKDRTVSRTMGVLVPSERETCRDVLLALAEDQELATKFTEMMSGGGPTFAPTGEAGMNFLPPKDRILKGDEGHETMNLSEAPSSLNEMTPTTRARVQQLMRADSDLKQDAAWELAVAEQG